MGNGQQADIPQSLLLNSETLLPFCTPPFGTLVAVNLRDRSLAWAVSLGVMADPLVVPDALTWDSVRLGGPTTTGGGLVFIDATSDGVIRAFDIRTGVLLWQDQLPAGGQATAMSYEHERRQYVVIAA